MRKRPQKLVISRFTIVLTWILLPISSVRGVDLAIASTTAIDAVNGLRKNQTILIEKDKILSIGNSSEITIPKGTKTIDGQDLYVIPGLWDAHVHFSYDEEIAPAMLPLFLANGITYVRDTGGPINKVRYWKAVANGKRTEAPEVFIAGPLLDGVPTIYTGENPTRPLLARTVANPEEGIEAVNSLEQNGADLIKAYEMLTPETFTSILDRAAALQLPVTGHIPLAMDATLVSNLGLNSIEHLRNLEISCSSLRDLIIEERKTMLASGAEREGGTLRQEAHQAHRLKAIDTLDWQRCKNVLDVHISNETYHNPTTALLESTYDSFLTSPKWTATFRELPIKVAKRWKNTVFIAVEEANPKEKKLIQQYKDYMAWARRVISYLGKQDMILAGTDTPIYFLTPGASLHKELEALVRAGMSPLQTLAAATNIPARYFGLENSRGSLEPGMLADMVILKKNPLEDIRNTRSIKAVVRLGTLHTKKKLYARIPR